MTICAVSLDAVNDEPFLSFLALVSIPSGQYYYCDICEF